MDNLLLAESRVEILKKFVTAYMEASMRVDPKPSTTTCMHST